MSVWATQWITTTFMSTAMLSKIVHRRKGKFLPSVLQSIRHSHTCSPSSTTWTVRLIIVLVKLAALPMNVRRAIVRRPGLLLVLKE